MSMSLYGPIYVYRKVQYIKTGLNAEMFTLFVIFWYVSNCFNIQRNVESSTCHVPFSISNSSIYSGNFKIFPCSSAVKTSKGTTLIFPADEDGLTYYIDRKIIL